MKSICSGGMLLGAVMVLRFLSAALGQPSMRSTLFLSRLAATWNEAREVCRMRSATLLKLTSENVLKQLRVLDASDDWDGDFQSLLAQGGFWTGLYERNNSASYAWQDCQDLGAYTAWASGQPLDEPGQQCVFLDPDSRWRTAPCNESHFYICQRSESECWFDPLEETTAAQPAAGGNATTDESACAQMCRNAYNNAMECWGFSFRSADRMCRLHFNADATAFTDMSLMASNLVSHSNWTFYRKICLAGLKKTDNLTFSISNPEPHRQYCTEEEQNTTSSWDEDVCYCECEREPSVWDPTIDQEAYQEEFQREVAALAVDSRNTSSSQRKLISVEDKRPSAQGIGYVGVLFLCLVFGGIVLLDANVLFSHVQRLLQRCRKSSSSSSASSSKRLRSVSPSASE